MHKTVMSPIVAALYALLCDCDILKTFRTALIYLTQWILAGMKIASDMLDTMK